MYRKVSHSIGSGLRTINPARRNVTYIILSYFNANVEA